MPNTNHVEKSLRPQWLYPLSGIAGLLCGVGFFLSLIGLLLSSFGASTAQRGVSFLENNWLVVLFKLHAGFSGIRSSMLQGVNALDLVLLALFALFGIGLFGLLRKVNKVWAFIAVVQPILGILLYLITRNAGRSALMGALLVASAVMLARKRIGKWAAVLGLLSSVFLLLGDFSEGVLHSPLIAVLMAIGYLGLLIWLWVMGVKLIKANEEKE